MRGISTDLAKVLIKQGYQKVPRDCVVLPKHNPNNKTTWTQVPDELWCALINTNQAIEKAHQETAKEILQELYSKCIVVGNGILAIRTEKIDEIAKKSGVKIENDD